MNEAITGVLLDSIRHLRKHVVSLSSVWSGLLPVDNCLNYSSNILHLYLLLDDTKTCHWSLWIRKVSNIPRGSVAKNAEIRAVSGCPPLSNMVTERRLRFFGHSAHSAPDEDRHRAVAAVLREPPSDWKRPSGRPNHTWLKAIELDLRPLNIGPSYVWKKAASREHWCLIVEMAMPKKSIPWRERESVARRFRFLDI